MNTKAFIVLIVAVLVLGGSIGGAFAGGIALGKSQDADETAAATTLPGGFQAPSSRFGQGDAAGSGGDFTQGNFNGSFNVEDRAALRDRIQSGEISPEELSALQSQFQGGGFDSQSQDHDSEQFQGGFGRDSGGFGGALFGTVASLDGGTLTVETIDGSQEVVVGDDTAVRLSVDGTLADLETGTRVTVFGERAEDGTFQVSSIQVVPENSDGFFQGGRFGGQFGGGASDSDGEAPAFGGGRQRPGGTLP